METTEGGKRGLGEWIRVTLACSAIAAGMIGFGCETTEGAGRDLENLGDNIEDAAEDND